MYARRRRRGIAGRFVTLISDSIYPISDKCPICFSLSQFRLRDSDLFGRSSCYWIRQVKRLLQKAQVQRQRRDRRINIPYICSPERATELGRPLLSFALSGLGSIVGAFPVVPHYAALRASPLDTFCRAAGAGLVDSAKASSACRVVFACSA